MMPLLFGMQFVSLLLFEGQLVGLPIPDGEWGSLLLEGWVGIHKPNYQGEYSPDNLGMMWL